MAFTKTGFLLIYFLSASNVGFVRASGWSYSGHDGPGPEEWADHFKSCGGTNQSPIDIPTSSAVYCSGLGLTFIDYHQPNTGTFTVINNGHSVAVKMPTGSGTAISGGRLPNTYILDQFHFHWGSDNAKGSEHSLNGIFYPLEIHLVHYNSRYANFAVASDKDDGLSVLSVLVKVNPAANEIPEINQLVDHLPHIPYHGQGIMIPSFKIEALLPKDRKYYRYQGSLTTPGCFESVTWSVFANAIEFTAKQAAAFRGLLFNRIWEPKVPLVNNFRPVQPLNGRPILKSEN